MSKLGIAFLYIAVAGVVVAGIFGFLLIGKYNDSKLTVTQTQQSLDKSRGDVVKAKQAADAATQEKEKAATELTEQKAKFDDISSKLADAQKEQDTLKSAVNDAKDAQTKAEAALANVNTVLGMSPEETKAAMDKLKQELAADQSERKILEDQQQAMSKQVADLMDSLHRMNNGAQQPPGISGKVTFVNRAWNFVVLNVGLSNGVVPNGELIIYHGRNFIGKVKITSAEATSSVGDILPGTKADIQTGDDVIN